MVDEVRHMRACLAALRQIREHVVANPEQEEHDSALFDVWMSKLEDGTGQDFSQFQIDNAYVPANEFLVTVASVIAYLESMLGIESGAADPAAGASTAASRQAPPIDADFTDVESGPAEAGQGTAAGYFQRLFK